MIRLARLSTARPATFLAAVLLGEATVVPSACLGLAKGRTEALDAWERLAAGGGWVVRRAQPAGAVAPDDTARQGDVA